MSTPQLDYRMLCGHSNRIFQELLRLSNEAFYGKARGNVGIDRRLDRLRRLDACAHVRARQRVDRLPLCNPERTVSHPLGA